MKAEVFLSILDRASSRFDHVLLSCFGMPSTWLLKNHFWVPLLHSCCLSINHSWSSLWGSWGMRLVRKLSWLILHALDYKYFALLANLKNVLGTLHHTRILKIQEVGMQRIMSLETTTASSMENLQSFEVDLRPRAVGMQESFQLDERHFSKFLCLSSKLFKRTTKKLNRTLSSMIEPFKWKWIQHLIVYF